MPVLPPDEWFTIANLITGQPLRSVYAALCAGTCTGQVWRNAAGNAVCLWVGRIYGAGQVDTDLLAEVALAAGNEVMLQPPDPDWHAPMAAMFPDRTLQLLPRRFYTFPTTQAVAWPAVISAGYRLARVDREILTATSLVNHDRLLMEIHWMWPSVEAYLNQGFGICALVDSTIAGWCTAEYVSPGQCGIGIETVTEHQRRGLATAMAVAFAADARARGITPHWDCWTGNAASWHTAEKAGFVLEREYAVLFG